MIIFLIIILILALAFLWGRKDYWKELYEIQSKRRTEIERFSDYQAYRIAELHNKIEQLLKNETPHN